ncbi:uncharacterized protein METZ01_LOCUS349945, partial [marine metagenome]
NLGTGALQRSSLRRLYLNGGRYEVAADETLRWVFCNVRRANLIAEHQRQGCIPQ